MRRKVTRNITSRMPHSVLNPIYLFSCLIFLVLSTVLSSAFAQTSDELKYSQIQNSQLPVSAEAGSNDLQASVIIVAGDSVFIDAGRVAGVEKSNYIGGQLMRRTSVGEELIANFIVSEVGGEVSQVVVETIFGKEVQLGDRAVFGAFSAQLAQPSLNGMQVDSSRKNSLNGLFADTNPNAGRTIGLANTVDSTTNNLTSSRAYNPDEIQVTKSGVIPTGSAAAAMAGFVANAVAKTEATGAPLYCSDARFAQREACQAAPVPLMGNSSVAPVTMPASTMPTANTPLNNSSSNNTLAAASAITSTANYGANTASTTASVSVPEYCSSQAYSSRPECAANSHQTTQQQQNNQASYQHVSQTAQPAQAIQSTQAAAVPGYCIDARFATRSECMSTGASTASVSRPAATQSTHTTSSVQNKPSYCSTPGNQSRPECLGTPNHSSHSTSAAPANQHINQRGYNQTNSHVSTATAATSNVAAGTALAIDPYTGKPYTTSYQGYNGDTATPLVHTAAHSQTTQAQQHVAPSNHASTSHATNHAPTSHANTGNTTIGLATNVASTSSVDIPAHVGPSTIANQTLATTANTSYTTAQTYYDSDWGDNWDPTYVNTTPNATGIIPPGSPAPYFLRIARVKNNLGFPNEAIEILEMGLANHPNETTLQSEITMIYRMLSDGGTPDDWCAPEEIGIAPEPIATVDNCPEEEVYEDYSYEAEHHDDHSHDDEHGHEHDEYGHHDEHDEENSHYENDYHENIQVSTRYNAPLDNDAPLSNRSYAAQQNQGQGANQSYAAQQNQGRQNQAQQNVGQNGNQSYAGQNKPQFNSPVGMANEHYDSEKGGIVRPLWNINK